MAARRCTEVPAANMTWCRWPLTALSCDLKVTLLILLVQVLPGTDDETSTQGLDNLGSRCAEYYKQGELSLSPCPPCLKTRRGGPGRALCARDASSARSFRKLPGFSNLLAGRIDNTSAGIPGTLPSGLVGNHCQRFMGGMPHTNSLLVSADSPDEGLLLNTSMCCIDPAGARFAGWMAVYRLVTGGKGSVVLLLLSASLCYSFVL